MPLAVWRDLIALSTGKPSIGDRAVPDFVIPFALTLEVAASSIEKGHDARR
jgi:hypothetical protein